MIGPAIRGNRAEALAALRSAAALAAEVEGTQVAPWVCDTYRVLGDVLRGSDRAAALTAARARIDAQAGAGAGAEA